jgi:hypothetical protein
MQATTVREALRASLAGALGTFLSAVPRIIAFAIVLAAGWLIAALIARATIAVLRAIRFNDLARRSGLAGFVQNMGVRQDATGWGSPSLPGASRRYPACCSSSCSGCPIWR